MLDVHVIEDSAAAAIAVEPMKSQLLAALVEPASAATLATRLGIARQKVNYHLRSLEAHGLVQVSEERLWGGLTERVMVASGASYVVSPVALGPIAADPSRRTSPLSASYLIALAARIVREVSGLMRRARGSGQGTGHAVDRHGSPFQVRRRPSGIRQGAHSGGHDTRREVSRRDDTRRAAAPPGRRGTSATVHRYSTSTQADWK